MNRIRVRILGEFPIDGGRYIVFLFRADRFEGELKSSEEGKCTGSGGRISRMFL
ncbi:MAG: hypothetical protein HFH75_19750 [Lachnospiraceae bacterium]|nr:hypothetical protein [Lachnospiraceae bacterium]